MGKKLQFTKQDIEKARRKLNLPAPTPKKPKKQLSFAEKLEKTMAKHNKRQAESMALFRREQVRQGLKPDQPISLMEMVKGMKERKKK